jgi:hypothetical protein
VQAKNGDGLVFVVGLPKCGTLSLQEYFVSLGEKSCHQTLSTNKSDWVGLLMQGNLDEGLPLVSGKLARCNVFTQMDCAYSHCHVWPQITMLSILASQYPKARYILNTRNESKHVESILKWNNLAKRIATTGTPKFQIDNGDLKESLKIWVERHNSDVREFFYQNPLIRFLDIDIEDPEISDKLAYFLGRPATKFPWTHKSRAGSPALRRQQFEPSWNS